MHCFSLLSKVLDEVWEELDGSKEDKITKIREAESKLSRHYAALSKTTDKSIDYNDPAARYAYLAKYVASHSNIVAEYLRKRELSKEIFSDKSKTLEISCIGGGPGSDILGFLKYIGPNEDFNKKISFNLIDREPAWSESWTDLYKKVDQEFTMNINFSEVDALKPETWINKKKAFRSDIITMIYFMSELYPFKDNDNVLTFFSHIFEQMKSGAILLLIDNAADCFYGWFDLLVDTTKFKILTSENDIKITIPTDEEKSALGDHKNHLQNSPKLTANICVRIIQKA